MGPQYGRAVTGRWLRRQGWSLPAGVRSTARILSAHQAQPEPQDRRPKICRRVPVRHLGLQPAIRTNRGHRHREHGPKVVSPQRQPGRPRELAATRCEGFETRLMADPTEADEVCSLGTKQRGRHLPRSLASPTCRVICHLPHRLGLSRLIARPRPRSDCAWRRQWQDYATCAQKTTPERPNWRIKIWVQDEARVGQLGTQICR